MRIITSAALITAILLSLQSPAFAGYGRDIERATKRGQVFDLATWDARLIWHATFFSDKFRNSFAKEYAKIRHFGPTEREDWFARQQNLQKQQWEFFISFYTKMDYKNFSLDSGSFWKIFLKTEEGEEIQPTSIELVSFTPYEQALYPYVNRWSEGYRVIFPKAQLGKSVCLTLQSVAGESTLKWKVK